jgi:hypothetical protein
MAIQVVTAGRYNQRSWVKHRGGATISGPIFGVKVYEARPRLDGVYVWRLLTIVQETGTFTGLDAVGTAAQEYAVKHNYPYLPGVKHGALMNKVIL